MVQTSASRFCRTDPLCFAWMILVPGSVLVPGEPAAGTFRDRSHRHHCLGGSPSTLGRGSSDGFTQQGFRPNPNLLHGGSWRRRAAVYVPHKLFQGTSDNHGYDSLRLQ